MRNFAHSLVSPKLIRSLVSLLTAAIVFWMTNAVAQEDTAKRAMRAVSFELDTVEGAISYEVEISRPSGKLVGRFPLKTPAFSGKLVPGTYRLRSRSTDSRGLAGDWSDYESFEVHALAPTLIQPADKSVAKPEADGRVRFRWEKGAGAVRYRIVIEASARTISEFSDTTEFQTWLPAGAYNVKVLSLLADGSGGEKSQAQGSFSLEQPLPKGLFGQIDFVWPQVSGAQDYEMELAGGNGVDSHKVLTPEWHGPYKAGNYRVRSRARKADGSYTDWSSTQSLEVLSQSPNVTSPAFNAQIETKDKIETHIDFNWTRSVGAAKYRLEAQAIDLQGKPIGEAAINEVTTSTSYSAKLEVGKGYAWKLSPLNANGEMIEASVVSSQLLVLGSELSAPKIDNPGTRYVNQLNWHSTDVNKTFDYSLQRWDAGKKGWVKVVQKRKSTEVTIPFKAEYPGGNYRIAVRSVADYRKPSEFNILEFPVHDGDRSPEATEAQRRREFLEPISGLYFLASYLITNMSYTGNDAETNSSIAFSALGGTGRLGVGYNPPQSQFGILGLVDLSGFQISQKNYTFASSEAHVQWRQNHGNNQYRYSAGLFYKELVEVRGTLGQLSMTDVATVATAGPHAGIEAVHALNENYGVQFNARIYMSMMGLKTPNGGAISPTFSYQLGVLGSRKLSPNAIGYIGYAYRGDNAAYKSTANDDSSGSITSLAGPDSLQQIGVSGHYLNLIYEWSY